MKKVLVGMAAVAMLAGCSQNEEYGNSEKMDQINFVSRVAKSTRVAEATNDTLQKNGFHLYAYNTGTKKTTDDDMTSLGSEFINVSATYDKTNTKWSLGQDFYWPLKEYIQFFAYSPAKSITNWTATGIFPSFDYTIQDTQEDLLAVAVVDKIKESTAVMDPVSLKFQHILTQINFKLAGKDTGYKYSVTAIQLAGVANKGTFTYSSDKGGWSAQSGTATYDYTFTTPIEVTDQAAVEIATDDNALMLMPNSSLTDVKVKVTYSTTNAATGKKYYDGTKEVALTGSWEVGQKILYTLSLPSGADNITVTASVDGWTAGEGGNTGTDWTEETPAQP